LHPCIRGLLNFGNAVNGSGTNDGVRPRNYKITYLSDGVI
jgi:hypothetical protein